MKSLNYSFLTKLDWTEKDGRLYQQVFWYFVVGIFYMSVKGSTVIVKSV